MVLTVCPSRLGRHALSPGTVNGERSFYDVTFSEREPMPGEPEFWNKGFLVRRQVLEKARMIGYRRQVLAGDLAPGDVLSSKGVGDLVTDPAVVSMAGDLLGETPQYFGDGNVSVRSTARGYHKDNADRYDSSAPDWRSAYPILRVGIYLQDHRRHSGGLNVRQGSHLVPDVRTGRTHYLGTRVGDVVAWNLRTTHSGNGVVIRPGVPLAVSPRLAGRLPGWLTCEPQVERVAIFITYGAAGAHLDRYIDYLRSRTYQRSTWSGRRRARRARARAAVARPRPRAAASPRSSRSVWP